VSLNQPESLFLTEIFFRSSKFVSSFARRACLLFSTDVTLETDEDELIDEKEQVHMDEPMEVAFEGIRMELQQKKGKASRLLLDGSIRGRARPGRMLAIMGPSGR
jgi:hypothetical protein